VKLIPFQAHLCYGTALYVLPRPSCGLRLPHPILSCRLASVVAQMAIYGIAELLTLPWYYALPTAVPAVSYISLRLKSGRMRIIIHSFIPLIDPSLCPRLDFSLSNRFQVPQKRCTLVLARNSPIGPYLTDARVFHYYLCFVGLFTATKDEIFLRLSTCPSPLDKQ
jgi:hypothetical protein